MPATASSARRADAALGARGVTVEDYLAHIGAREAGPPSVQALAELQARHLERVVFENLEIQRGRPTTVDYAESAERIVKRGRGGYCFHLNGAFGLLLEALGYEVSRRRGTVQPPPGTPPGRHLNHLVVLVHGLPTGAHPEGTWWAEVGFGRRQHPAAGAACRGRAARRRTAHLRAGALADVHGRLAHAAGRR
jgi:arylamine N-acetyltransferase